MKPTQLLDEVPGLRREDVRAIVGIAYKDGPKSTYSEDSQAHSLRIQIRRDDTELRPFRDSGRQPNFPHLNLRLGRSFSSHGDFLRDTVWETVRGPQNCMDHKFQMWKVRSGRNSKDLSTPSTCSQRRMVSS